MRRRKTFDDWCEVILKLAGMSVVLSFCAFLVSLFLRGLLAQ